MGLRAPLWLRRFPVIFGMALLVLPWGFVAANGVAGRIWPGWTMIKEYRLFGVEPPVARPVLDFSGVWSGRFQKGFTSYFDHSLPLLASAVELKNQIYYSLLHQSGVVGVIVGKHWRLFERGYIDEYCSRNTSSITKAGDRWASELAQIQSWYPAQNKVFVYIITPSKAATYPQYLPDGRLCRSSPADRDALDPAWDAILDRHGVRYVDAATMVRQAKPDYPFEMFPPGGTHWNEVAAALAAQAVIRRIDAAPTPWKLQDFAFTWTMVRPTDIARDITDLLNVPFPRLDYRVPEVSLTPPSIRQSVCRPVDIAVVGGSFTYEVLWTMMKLPCAPKIDFYSYFHTDHAVYPGDIRGPVNPQQRDDALLDRANIVMLEENEMYIMRSEHGPAFYDLIAAHDSSHVALP